MRLLDDKGRYARQEHSANLEASYLPQLLQLQPPDFHDTSYSAPFTTTTSILSKTTYDRQCSVASLVTIVLHSLSADTHLLPSQWQIPRARL